MSVALTIVTEKVIEALLQRTAAGIKHAHAPFPHHSRSVALRFENFRHRDGFLRKWILTLSLRDFPISAHRRMSAVQTCDQRGATRRTDGGAAIPLQKSSALARHLIHARRLDDLLTVAAEITLCQVITQDENDVRFPDIRVRANRETKCQKSGENFHSRSKSDQRAGVSTNSLMVTPRLPGNNSY